MHAGTSLASVCIQAQAGHGGLSVSSLFAGSQRARRLHLMVDTGLGREGVRIQEVPEVTAAILAKPHWSLEGLYTHWCCPLESQHLLRNGAFSKANRMAAQV